MHAAVLWRVGVAKKLELAVAFVLVLSLGACGEQTDDSGPGSSGGDGGTGAAEATGGSTSASGGATGGSSTAFEMRPLSDLAVECAGQGVCDSGLMGTWKVDDRCDRSGTETLEACSPVEATWQATRIGGELSFDSYEFSWGQSTEFGWTVEVTDLCGVSCAEFPGQLAPKWSFLECSTADGTCSCAGVDVQTVELAGYYAAGAEGLTLTPFDALLNPDVPSHNVAVCAEAEALTLYSEELGNIVVRKE